MGVEPKIGFFPPKMDGLFHKIDDLGGETPIVGNTHICLPTFITLKKKQKNIET